MATIVARMRLDVTLYIPCLSFFHIRTMLRDIIKVFYSPTNAQVIVLKKKLRGLSPRANYTDRAAAAGRRS